MAAEVGVPGVGVHEVGALAPTGDRQVDAYRLQGGVGRAELRQVGVRHHAGLVARGAERLHLHVEVGEPSQGTNQLGDVDTRAAVDGGWVLLGQDVDAHLGDATGVTGA